MRIIVFIIFLIIAFPIHAMEAVRGTVPFNATGEFVAEAPVRKAPPHGIFNLFVGKEIKSAGEGNTVNIMGKKTYSGFSGTHIWYQVDQICKGQGPSDCINPSEGTMWWIYGGLEGANPQIRINEIEK